MRNRFTPFILAEGEGASLRIDFSRIGWEEAEKPGDMIMPILKDGIERILRYSVSNVTVVIRGRQ